MCQCVNLWYLNFQKNYTYNCRKIIPITCYIYNFCVGPLNKVIMKYTSVYLNTLVQQSPASIQIHHGCDTQFAPIGWHAFTGYIRNYILTLWIVAECLPVIIFYCFKSCGCINPNLKMLKKKELAPSGQPFIRFKLSCNDAGEY